MRHEYVEISPGVDVSIEAAQASPKIRRHVDGPLLSWAGHLHWLTWRERYLLWVGRETAESLAQRHWPRRLDFTPP